MRHLLLVSSLILTLAGCGGAPTAVTPTQSTSSGPAASPANDSSPATAPHGAAPNVAAAAIATEPAAADKAKAAGPTTAPPAQEFVTDDAVRIPATVEEAAKALDLNQFPLLPGTPAPGGRSMAQLSYEGPGEVKSGYEFQRKNLVERGWKELPDPQVTDQEYGATGGHVYGRLGRGNAECNVSEASKCRALGAVAALLAQEFASEIVSLRARAGAGDARDHSHGRTDGGVRALGLVRAAVGMVV